MYYVYVLKSLRNGKRYISSTKNLPEDRLKQHNYGSNKWTKENGPFELIYKEQYLNITEARKRENFLKSGVGRKFLNESVDVRALSSVG
ncbi:MAG: GIY-YIG nuclease family protein [Candidatus Omnitrophota bacterium]